MQNLPKIIGSDIELGNFLLGVDKVGGTGREASRLMLSHMSGVMSTHDIGGFYASTMAGANGVVGSTGSREPADPRDFGRKWLTNGGCIYIDSDHIEIASCETTNAWDWVAAYYAQLMLVREAQERLSERLSDGMSVQMLVCNSDGRGNSWGSHFNVLITRRAYLNIFEQKMHYLLWLAACQASSVILTGLGKVGSEIPGSPVDYQLSQRADFFEEIVSSNTMFRRPIINSRDEAHCFPVSDFARFHHIACDSNLCPVANLLKAGMWQILLAMVEAESEFLCFSALFESPLDAWQAFSRDPSLTTHARTIEGELLSALDHQRIIFDAASRFYEAGECHQTVPRAGEILALWGETLDMLAGRDWERLSGRLDWVLKKRLLEDALESNPGMTWQSPEVKYLDLMYSSLSPADGLFWPYLDAGVVEQVVDPQRIETLKTLPPDDTRAFTRGHLMRGRGEYQIDHANWDSVRIRFNSAGASDLSHGPSANVHGRVFTFYLDTPFGSTAADNPSLANDGEMDLPYAQDDFRSVQIKANKDTSTWNLKNEHSKHLLRKLK